MGRHRVSSDSTAAQGRRTLQRRVCLRCDGPFLSEGPHNRLCKRCRELLAASPTELEEYSVGYF